MSSYVTPFIILYIINIYFMILLLGDLLKIKRKIIHKEKKKELLLIRHLIENAINKVKAYIVRLDENYTFVYCCTFSFKIFFQF